jgi:hypothetical protein
VARRRERVVCAAALDVKRLSVRGDLAVKRLSGRGGWWVKRLSSCGELLDCERENWFDQTLIGIADINDRAVLSWAVQYPF